MGWGLGKGGGASPLWSLSGIGQWGVMSGADSTPKWVGLVGGRWDLAAFKGTAHCGLEVGGAWMGRGGACCDPAPFPQHLHGRHLRHPFTGQLLPIVTDPSVEPARGTGTGTSMGMGLGPVRGQDWVGKGTTGPV